ncbi:MAG TPA: sigma-70 family RNA polymerase sigma factor [Sedimentisphaerales bacterium]|nr:sigma-70 family RNA polymerase sigma factor [Sedimentisphaerales bacterium]
MADKQHQKVGWLELLRSGDHTAFAEFVDKYKSQVFLCCRTLGLAEDQAEDVASDTFLAAYKMIAKYRGQADLGTWLWTIAYRQGINYLRKNGRFPELICEQSPTPVGRQEDTPTAAAYSKEQQELVWAAVKQLPTLWATAVILHYRQEKSLKDIALIMKTKQNTVKTYLFRARKMLQQLLADVFGEDIDVR